MKDYSYHADADLFIEKFSKEKSGLLALAQPLIARIAYLHKEKDSSLSFTSVSQEYLKAFIKNSPVSLGFLDEDLRIVHLSPGLDSWIMSSFRKRLNEAGAQTPLGFPFIELLSPLPERIKRALKANLKGKSKKFHVDYTPHNKKTSFVHWESFPWYDENSKILGVMIFCKDVTRQHQLFLANKKLNQCNEMLENFSLIFSHDLIQPTRQATNFLSILEESLLTNPHTDDVIYHALEAIKKSLNQVRTISEGVALYCRNGNLTINSEPICLSNLIEEVRKSCLDDKKIEMNVLIDEKVMLQANRVTLLQLFQNLLANAVKHDTSPVHVITLSGKKKDNFYEIYMHNKGFCSSKVKRRKLFNAFESSGNEGAGLGLMICKKIVTAYKGKISIKSSPAKGTTVIFNLPLASF